MRLFKKIIKRPEQDPELAQPETPEIDESQYEEEQESEETDYDDYDEYDESDLDEPENEEPEPEPKPVATPPKAAEPAQPAPAPVQPPAGQPNDGDPDLELLKMVARRAQSAGDLDLGTHGTQAPGFGTPQNTGFGAPQPAAPYPPQQPAAAPNIWDLEAGGGAPRPTPAQTPSHADTGLPDLSAHASATPGRRRRVKTRLLGFEAADTPPTTPDIFNTPTPDVFSDTDLPMGTEISTDTRFPVGWVVVVKGPGYGESFPIKSGMSAIGRGTDQAVSLDFGDSTISRSQHAAIVYDPESVQFYLGHGNKSNIVRLNGQPVISNELIKTGDLIRLGQTTLRFIALCGEDFTWSEDTGEGDDDVEIA